MFESKTTENHELSLSSSAPLKVMRGDLGPSITVKILWLFLAPSMKTSASSLHTDLGLRITVYCIN